MKQIVKWIGGTDFPIATDEVNKVTQEMNKEGYKLTFATCQCRDNQPWKPTDFMVVFTKEE